MARLKRDGLAPLTDGFAERYRFNEAEERHPIAESVTPEEFKEMLEPLGITSAKGLAGAIGVSPQWAREILRNPQKLTTEQRNRLQSVSEPLFSELYDEEWSAESDALFDPDNESEHAERADSAHAERVKLFEKFEVPTTITRGMRDKIRTIRNEYQARALMEGFRLLDAGERASLLGALCGLLHVSGSDGACAMAESIEATGYGAGTVDESDLANLVSAEAIGGDAEARSVLEEYAGPVKKRKN